MNTKIRKQRKINRAEFIDNYVKLYDSNNNSFLVSAEDYEKIKWRMWRVDTKTGYVSTRIGGKSVRLHRYIMNPPENKTVDHINHDKTDNAELRDHYGDILYMSGEKDAAVEQWIKAKELGKESSVLDRKIAEKKYIEENL